MLTAADLAAMRADQAAWLVGTAVVQTRVPTSDGAGGFDETWAASGTVACRVSYLASQTSIGGGDQVRGAAVRDIAPWTVTLPHDADVSSSDRLVVEGRVLQVVAVAAATSIQTAVRCACVEVR